MKTIPAVSAVRVEAVREFSRFYTALLGVLGEGLLDTPYSLTQARVLFELGRGRASDAAALRATLDLDSGYLSRLLAAFERRGLVRRAPSALDGRRQTVSLTPAGRRAYRTLDTRSVAQVTALLAGVADEGQRELVAAMAQVRSILGGPPAVSTIVLRGLRPGDLGWVIQRHGEVYAREYGWEASFEGLVARICADYVEHLLPRKENAWIAELNGERAGCVFCVRKDDEAAQLRILLVEPWARGKGIGARLVDECLRFARGAGYQRITLWTNDVLDSARRIYVAAGFTLVKSEAHHSFGKDLVGQHWERTLG